MFLAQTYILHLASFISLASSFNSKPFSVEVHGITEKPFMTERAEFIIAFFIVLFYSVTAEIFPIFTPRYNCINDKILIFKNI